MEINKPIATILLFIITLLLVFLFVVPKYTESNTLQSEFLSKEIEYTNKAAYFSTIAELAKNIDGRKDELQKIDDSLPSKFSMSELIYFLQKKGSDSNLDVKSVSLSTPTSENAIQQGSSTSPLPQGIRNVTMTMTATGGYVGLKKFITSLENSARLFEINNITFGQPDNGKYNFQLEVTTHTY